MSVRDRESAFQEYVVRFLSPELLNKFDHEFSNDHPEFNHCCCEDCLQNPGKQDCGDWHFCDECYYIKCTHIGFKCDLCEYTICKLCYLDKPELKVCHRCVKLDKDHSIVHGSPKDGDMLCCRSAQKASIGLILPVDS